MTKPQTDEPKATFLHRFMADADACREYPNATDRFERGAALWDNRETLHAANAMGYNAERDGAEFFPGRHLQTGVVGYPEMKHPITGAAGISVLIEKDTIDRMRASARGIPVVNWAHDMSGGAQKWIADGKAVGVMTDSFWNGEDAWEHCGFMLWDKEAKANARNGFRLSNAWKEDEIDWTPGVHNGVRYDGRLIAAHYTHLAIVPNPRYEGAVIFANSIGGIMKLFGFGKDGKTVEVSKETVIDIGGKPRKLEECVNALAAADAAAAVVTAPAGSALKDDDIIEVDGKKRTVLEMKNALIAADKVQAAKPPVVAEAAKPEANAAAAGVDVKSPEFLNAVAAAAKSTVEAMVGEGFFNGIKALAEKRGGAGEATTQIRKTERQRVEEGRKRFGRKDKTAAAK